MKRLPNADRGGMVNQHKKRTLLAGAIAGTALVALLAALVPRLLVRQGGDGNGKATASNDAASPNVRWGPEEVVRYQLAALRDSGPGREGIRQCYQFASPLIRASTGPFARFERMVRSPPYDVMLRATHTLVGKAVELEGLEGQAAVLVTMVDSAHAVHVFRFILSKQQQAPYENCWMTDSVDNLPSLARSRQNG
jgi:hypothetical protein